jgi:hypothetical protein
MTLSTYKIHFIANLECMEIVRDNLKILIITL